MRPSAEQASLLRVLNAIAVVVCVAALLCTGEIPNNYLFQVLPFGRPTGKIASSSDNMNAAPVSPNAVPRGVPYFALNVRDAFARLTPRQRLYAHFMTCAGWAGTAIVATQLSRESLPLLHYFFTLFDASGTAAKFRELAITAGNLEDDVDKFLEYAAMLYSNMGNYLSFGDSKFIPAISRDVFLRIVDSTLAVLGAEASTRNVPASPSEALTTAIYDESQSVLALAFPPKGVTAYYSANVVEADAVIANKFLESHHMSAYNTRVWKNDTDGSLTVRVASASESAAASAPSAAVIQDTRVELRYGDHARSLQRVASYLREAAKHAENDIQRRMLASYIKHFELGDVEDHKESQRLWVADKQPAVETNIGFIESYRDPSGVRGEWEGFVAVVDKEQSKKFDLLVQNAEPLIQRLPWGAAFEKDIFSRPDFTSLKIVGFASSGIPAGICIPNYDDIRQDVGFKNVYLDNVVSAINFNQKLTHLTDDDWERYRTSFLDAMSINVGVHELLGHGTGKLLAETEDGKFNFDRETVVNPFTSQPVRSWYKPGETWSSKFGAISNAYEECRAEAVALFLGMEREVLEIFGVMESAAQDNTVHVLWLNMVRAGVVGLEFYSPESKQWRQAHMRARYCILQKLLRANAANPMVTISHEPAVSLVVSIDAARIRTEGRQAIGELLVQLNVYKAMAAVEDGTKFFEELTTVTPQFESIRQTVLQFKKPRKQFTQPHTRLTADGTDVELVEFEGSVIGALDAMVVRHREIPLGEETPF